MSQITKPYGLVYNNDNSLCTTIRTDTRPFTGVNSFAVEKSSSNVLTDTESIIGNWETTNTVQSYAGEHKYNLYIVPLSLDSETLYTPKIELTTSGIAGEHTVSIDIQSYKEVTLSVGATIPNATYKDTGYTGRLFVTKTFVNGDKVGITLPDSYPGTVFNVRHPQIEEGPVATSYVEPSLTRSAGKFVLSSSTLASKGLSYNNNVIAFWAYIKGIASKHTAGNTDTSAYLFTNTDTSVNGISLYINSAGNLIFSTSGASTTTTSTHTLPAKGWHSICLISDTDSVKFYLDGVSTSTITSNLPAEINNFCIGSSTGTDQTFNSVIANLYIGLYKNTAGTMIWTDNYIQNLYAAKRPFIVDQPALQMV